MLILQVDGSHHATGAITAAHSAGDVAQAAGPVATLLFAALMGLVGVVVFLFLRGDRMKDVSARVDALAEKMALTAQVLKDVSVLSEKITNLLIEQGGSRTERGAVLAHIHDLRESDKALQVMVHAMQRDLDRLMGKSGQ